MSAVGLTPAQILILRRISDDLGVVEPGERPSNRVFDDVNILLDVGYLQRKPTSAKLLVSQAGEEYLAFLDGHESSQVSA